MREPKKKPGDMARARYRHVRRQEIQDAISAVRRGETVQVKIQGELWELSPPDDNTSTGLVRYNGSRLEICWIIDKDGRHAVPLGNGGPLYLHGDELLAEAKRVGPEKPYIADRRDVE